MSEYRCVCGGKAIAIGVHYKLYPEPDCCCFRYECDECGIRFYEHQRKAFAAQFMEEPN